MCSCPALLGEGWRMQLRLMPQRFSLGINPSSPPWHHCSWPNSSRLLPPPRSAWLSKLGEVPARPKKRNAPLWDGCCCAGCGCCCQGLPGACAGERLQSQNETQDNFPEACAPVCFSLHLPSSSAVPVSEAFRASNIYSDKFMTKTPNMLLFLPHSTFLNDFTCKMMSLDLLLSPASPEL